MNLWCILFTKDKWLLSCLAKKKKKKKSLLNWMYSSTVNSAAPPSLVFCTKCSIISSGQIEWKMGKQHSVMINGLAHCLVPFHKPERCLFCSSVLTPTPSDL